MDRLVAVRQALGSGRLVLGTAQWGMRYGIANRTGRPGPNEVTKMLQLARAQQVVAIDTAAGYVDSERVVGAATAGDRSWVVCTKLAADVCQPGAVLDSIQRADASVESSRASLQRDAIDVLLLHRPWQRTWEGSVVWGRLSALRDRGWLVLLGVSATTPEEAVEAVTDPEVQVVQVAFSLIDQRLPRLGFFALADRTGTVVVKRSAFLQGAALMEPNELPTRLIELRHPLASIDVWAHDHGLTRHAALLRFALDWAPGAVVVGCERAEQLQENLDVLSTSALSRDQLRELASLVPDLSEDILNPARW